MKAIAWSALTLLAVAPALAQDKAAQEVVATERGAMVRWAKGDTHGYIDIAAPDITYFDTGSERRVDGIGEFRRDLERIHGTFHLDDWAIINPQVQRSGDVAVLTYNGTSRVGARETRWNVTEVYKKTPAGWRLWSSHFSHTKPGR
jgi:hypothetical protein